MIWKLIAKFCAKPAVANWLIRRAMKTPYVHIHGKDDELYMGRWWLFNPYPHPEEQRKNWFPISVRIHWIRRKDDDRDLHDHPWNARTIILKGWYNEVREDNRRYFRYSSCTAKLKFGEYHRITSVAPEGAWTLFITGKYRGTWGFLVDGVKVQWRKYLGQES
ncbi:hypothetical protein D3C87_1254410 [compost metagenome]